MFIPTTIKSLDFEKGLKSLDSPKDYFINMASSQDEKVYDDVTNMYIQYLDNDYSFLEDFLVDELLYDYKTERLLKILQKVQKNKYSVYDLKYIFKLNNKKNPELHFFIKNSRGNFSILLIDLYHLGIFGKKNTNGKSLIIPLEKIYKRKKNNKCKLENIKNIL